MTNQLEFSMASLRASLPLLLVLLSACSGDPEPNAAPESRLFDAAVANATAQTVALEYIATGTVVSDERVEISSRIAAYVRAVEVREGEKISRGKLLVELDGTDVDTRIRASTAARDQATAARADAARDAEDSAKLFARGMVAESHERKARLALAQATDALEAAEAALSQAKAERQYTQISSPVAGIVVARHQRVGDLASPGSPLLTVESDAALMFETRIPEQRIESIHIGDTVRIHLDALKRDVTGEVVRRVPSGDPVTRGFHIKVAMPATGGLLPGMFGRARFTIGERRAVIVPPTALLERGGLQGVFVVGDDQVLAFRWVRIGSEVENGISIDAGLDPGERIVESPTRAMREGDRLARSSPR